MNITHNVVAQRDRALIGGDYGAYRAQSTRRIHAIRKRLGATTPRGRKFTPRSAVSAEDVAKNAEWVALLLASSERAWADAMAMKSIQSSENTQKPLPGSTKRQIYSRYRRAITYATNLVEVLQAQNTTKASNQDLLEAKAYLALLQGGLDFERNKWPSCIARYSFTRQVYATLSTSTQSDIYQDLLDDTVDPSLKYAAYQSKLPRTKAIQDIAVENFPSTDGDARQEIIRIDSKAFETTAEKAAAQVEGAGDLPTEIEWRGRRVKLEDASISQALASASVREENLATTFASFEKATTSAKDLATIYDGIIDARQDAANATKTAIDELIAEGVDQGDARIQGLQVTRTAVNYGVIEWRVGRNRVLCGDKDGSTFEPNKPKQNQKGGKDGQTRIPKEEPNGRKIARLREKVALYDSILQNLEAVNQLPGVAADTPFREELESKKTYFRALKCLAIGRSHAVNGQISNALVLFSRAQQLSQAAKGTNTDTNSAPKLAINQHQLDDLRKHLTSLTLQYRGLADLKNTAAKSRANNQGKVYKPPLLERLHLNQYDDEVDLKNIVNYPPKLQPIPMKPLFFDLAWDYIQYPGKQAEISIQPASSAKEPITERKQEPPKKKGWFGFGMS